MNLKINRVSSFYQGVKVVIKSNTLFNCLEIWFTEKMQGRKGTS